MPAVNLLPPELRPRVVERRALYRRAGLVGVLVLAALLYGGFYGHLLGLQRRAAVLREQQQALALQAVQAQQLEQEVAELEKEAAALRKAAQSRSRWSALLADLRGRWPAGVWASRLAQQGPARLVVEGEARDVLALTALTSQLAGSPFFSSLVLVKAEGAGPVAFTIRATLAGAADEEQPK